MILLLFLSSACFLHAGESPRRGGTLRLGFPNDWRTLDPAIAFDYDSVPLQKLLFRGLIDFDTGTGLVTDQAEDWNISPDGRTYTFHLRPGTRFSNGREVEAADYLFSFERILDPKTGSSGQTYFLDIAGAKEFNEGKAPNVSGLEAPDKRTFIIHLTEPKFTFRYVLATVFASVLPRDVVQQYGPDFQYHLTGSGPYRVTEWRRNVKYHFERNPCYQGTDGNVDAVEIMFGGDATMLMMMIERGELDHIQANPADAVRLERDPKLRHLLQRVPTANTDYLFMNTELKPFDDVRVRRAVNYAINRERLVRLSGGFGAVANEIVPPSMPWSNPGAPHFEYNPEKARALLREAGYPNGFRTELWFELMPPAFARFAQGAQQDLREVGIDADLKEVTSTAFEVKVEARRQAPCGIWGWVEDYPDASDFLDVLLNGERITEQDCLNISFYNSPSANQQIDLAKASNDPEERTRLFRTAEDTILADAPWVPIIHEQLPMANNSRLHGTTPHPVWLWRYEWMWVDH